jgi:hypothetical protein
MTNSSFYSLLEKGFNRMIQLFLVQLFLVNQSLNVKLSHRYRSAKIDCLSFVLCMLLAQLIIGFFSSFFVAAVYSTNEENTCF